MERQAPCSLPGAAAGFQSWGYDPTWKKNYWNSAGDCFSVALLPLCSTQNGSFESERPKNLFWGVLFVHPPMAACEYCSEFFSLSARIMSSLLNCQLTGVGLSTSALEVHHLVLSEGETKGL